MRVACHSRSVGCRAWVHNPGAIRSVKKVRARRFVAEVLHELGPLVGVLVEEVVGFRRRGFRRTFEVKIERTKHWSARKMHVKSFVQHIHGDLSILYLSLTHHTQIRSGGVKVAKAEPVALNGRLASVSPGLDLVG